MTELNELMDRTYYAARALASRNLARQAANPAIAAIHADLAGRYEVLAARPDLTTSILPARAQAT
jgi:hypothetical protein